MNVRTFFVGALLVAATLPLVSPIARIAGMGAKRQAAPADATPETLPDWPTHFRDQPLTQLPLSPLEQRFARRFPGAIGRFTDGERIVVVRHVTRPTRQLHPAEDCFKGLGYRVGSVRPYVDADESTWTCFSAERDGERVRVCERIVDARGTQWTDASAWFWAAQYGGGPWWAWTVVSPETAR